MDLVELGGACLSAFAHWLNNKSWEVAEALNSRSFSTPSGYLFGNLSGQLSAHLPLVSERREILFVFYDVFVFLWFITCLMANESLGTYFIMLLDIFGISKISTRFGPVDPLLITETL